MKQIRLARQEDAAALLAIYRPYIMDTYITFEWDDPGEEAFANRIASALSRYPYLVYEEDGRILGYAYAGQQMDRTAYDWNAVLSIYVDQSERSKGIGPKLYGALLDLLQRQEVRHVYALISAPNPPSEAFHAKMGFDRLALFPQMGYKFGSWWGILWMGKQLNPLDDPAPFRPFPELSAEEIAAVLEQYKEE